MNFKEYDLRMKEIGERATALRDEALTLAKKMYLDQDVTLIRGDTKFVGRRCRVIDVTLDWFQPNPQIRVAPYRIAGKGDELLDVALCRYYLPTRFVSLINR